MGRPCVAVALDGAPEVVVDGLTGLLVEPENPQALAESLSWLLDDPALRERMGAAGRATVDPAFRAETMVDRIAAVYEELLAAR